MPPLFRSILLRPVLVGVSLLALGVALARPAPGGPKERPAQITVGWEDTFRRPVRWRALKGINRPDVFRSASGAMTMRLPHVPEGYPYSYQWGGIEREIDVDLGRYPIVAAYLPAIRPGSYAHLDIEVRDYRDRSVRSLRTNTLQQPGVTWVDLGEKWGDVTLRMRVRLIVGGPLTGAAAEYGWLRFVRRADLPDLRRHPSGAHTTVRP